MVCFAVVGRRQQRQLCRPQIPDTFHLLGGGDAQKLFLRTRGETIARHVDAQLDRLAVDKGRGFNIADNKDRIRFLPANFGQLWRHIAVFEAKGFAAHNLATCFVQLFFKRIHIAGIETYIERS